MRHQRRSRDKVFDEIQTTNVSTLFPLNPPKYLLGSPPFVGVGRKACLQIAKRIVLSVERTFLRKTISF